MFHLRTILDQKRSLFYLSYASLALTLNTLPGMAAESSSADDLSLADILNLSVSVGTKIATPVSDTPGSVKAYTDQDLKRLGYYTVADLANITPGYGTFNVWGEMPLETRGLKQDVFENNKHLLLIDGIPVNFARNYKIPTSEELPLYFAKRVEFLKGPASAMYGTSAFLGVVNVISKDHKENGSLVEVKASGGNHDSNRRVMSNAFVTSDLGEAKLNVGYFQKDASKSLVGDSTTWLNYDNQRSVFMNASYNFKSGGLKGLTPGFIYMKKTDGLGEAWYGNFSSYLNNINWETAIAYVKYETPITDQIAFNSYIKFNQAMEKGWHLPNAQDGKYVEDHAKSNIFAAYEIDIQDVEALAETKWHLSDKANLIVGLNFDLRKQLGESSFVVDMVPVATGNYVTPRFTIDDSQPLRTYSAYGQFTNQFDFLSGTLLTLGVRVDGSSFGTLNSFSQVSPRVALVQKLNDVFNLKLMYGTALRAPGLKEYGRNVEASGQGAIGLPTSLTAETIQSLEAGISYNVPHFSGNLSAFKQQINNALLSKNFPTDPNDLNNTNKIAGGFYNNTGKTSGYGVETDLQYIYNQDHRLFANFAWSTNKDNSDLYINDVPVATYTIGANTKFPLPFDLKGTLLYKAVTAYRSATTTDAQANDVKGTGSLDLNLTSDINDVNTLEFQVKNLLGTTNYYPNAGKLGLLEPGRNFLISWNVKF